MPLQKGFSANIEYLQEYTYGGGLYNPGTVTYLKRFSDLVTSLRLEGNPNVEILYGIDDVDGKTTNFGQKEYTLRLEYFLQAGAELGKWINRNSSNDLDSVAIVITYGGKYYHLKGCKTATIEISADIGEMLKVTHEIWANDIVVSDTDPLTNYSNLRHANALAGAYAKYSGANITKNGQTIGWGTKSFSATINHNLERVFKIYSSKAESIEAGKLEVSGTIDVYIEQGAKTHWEKIIQSPDTDINAIYISTGLSGMNITISDASFESFEFEMNNTDAVIVSSIPFVARSVSV